MNNEQVILYLKDYITNFDRSAVAVLYGSFAQGTETPESDIDIAVAFSHPITSVQKVKIVGELSSYLERSVDLLDLTTAGIVVLRQAMLKGKLILNNNPTLYGEIIKKMVFLSEDFLPLYSRILKERRDRWVK